MYSSCMRSAIHDVLPAGLRRSLSKFGHDLAVARRKRHLTVGMMAERTGLAKSTYARIEKGDPAVAMGPMRWRCSFWVSVRRFAI